MVFSARGLTLAETIGTASTAVGPKTRVLAELLNRGFPVPPFVAISTDSLASLAKGEAGNAKEREALLGEIAKDICEKLPAPRYAVRSSAFAEDSAATSNAGAFHSEIDVQPDQLPQAIAAVLADAERKVSLNQFSVLVQRYVEAEIAGVLFTRDPLGGRQMTVEYGDGACSSIVGGENLPHRFELFHTSTSCSHAGREFAVLIAIAKEIEQHFGTPQDIEWCFADNTWWVLQSRPVTTLSQAQFDGMKFLDEQFASCKPQTLERTAIAELSPTPCPLTFSLFQQLYAAGGPVAVAYRRFGVRYHPRDFLRLVGNQIFTDREAERQTLFPSQRLQVEGGYRQALLPLSDYLCTFCNSIAFARIKTRPGGLEQEVKLALERFPVEPAELPKALRHLLEEYPLIFSINLMADVAVGRFEAALRKLAPHAQVPLGELLTLTGKGVGETIAPPTGIIGNSLDLADLSPFAPAVSPLNENQPDFAQLLQVTGWRLDHLGQLHESAARLTRLREAGRWLTVMHVHRLRRAVFAVAASGGLAAPEEIFLFSLDEVLQKSFSSSAAESRRSERVSAAEYEFPDRIGSVLLPRVKADALGISPGIAEGVLVSEDQLIHGLAGARFAEKPILVTSVLAPHLVRYFDQIGGIVSERGGMLSHLAIMARERGIPAVVNGTATLKSSALGQRVRLNGSDGTIVMLGETNTQ